jgi:biotin carboxyl carrier protein
MSDTDHVLGLLDDLMRLATRHGARIEVEADGFAASVTPAGTGDRPHEQPHDDVVRDAASTTPNTQRVHASTVGIFTAPKPWSVGDAVKRGDVLGGVQSLGHISDVKAPADGRIHEVLVTTGAPVEYGQALFVIAVQ